MAKKNTKPSNKKVSNQNPPKIGFVEYVPRDQEIAERIAARSKVLNDLIEKELKKKKKKK